MKPRKLQNYSEEIIWIKYPSVISLLKANRGSKSAAKSHLQSQFLPIGSNVTIILLSAACVEGFLSECLKSYANRFKPRDSFEDKLNHEFLQRLTFVSYGAKLKMFSIPLGKPLDKILSNVPIQKDIQKLFTFRNCLAHAQSATYELYEHFTSPSLEYTLEGSYKDLRDYLNGKNLLVKHPGHALANMTGIENLFTNKVADHFADMVQPYMNEVLNLLPKKEADSIRLMVTMAFDV